ncbi:MAG TPA: hypothetical protein VIF15_13620 [Polyangiaceae bacterium]|jgi:hypothetical protein
MVRAWQWVAVSSMTLLLACPPKKAVDDGGADSAPTATAEVEAGPAPLAANQSDITRYPDETSINHAPISTRWSISNVRTQASTTSGDLVASIKSGTACDKIAEHGNFFLVVFDDPSDPNKKDMGWISQAVFSPEPPYKHIPIKCPVGDVAILLQGGLEQCVVQCTQDSNCPSGNVCTGDGILSNNGVPAGPIQFCRVGTHPADAGPPPPPPPVVDAGPTPPPAADAGPPKPSKPLDVKKVNGACPGGYAACGAVCRLSCKVDGDCGIASAHCASSFCLGPGSQPCGK